MLELTEWYYFSHEVPISIHRKNQKIYSDLYFSNEECPESNINITGREE